MNWSDWYDLQGGEDLCGYDNISEVLSMYAIVCFCDIVGKHTYPFNVIIMDLLGVTIHGI